MKLRYNLLSQYKRRHLKVGFHANIIKIYKINVITNVTRFSNKNYSSRFKKFKKTYFLKNGEKMLEKISLEKKELERMSLERGCR